MHRIVDRVQQTTTSTGTGALLLNGTAIKMFTFAGSSFADGDTFWGLVEHTTADEVEETLCTFHTGTPNYITRAATPERSTTGAKIDFSAGVKTVSLVGPATKTPYADNNGLFIFNGPIALAGVRESVSAPAINAGALTLNLSSASNFTVSNNANMTALTISGATADKSTAFLLQLTADGTPRTWTWPGSVTWPFGAPTLSSTSAKRDLLSFLSLDGGTSWLAFAIAQNF